jgi:hypothetical protein
MPNQLAKSKKRQSLAEHEAVLAALAEIARREGTTVMALLRRAARELIRKQAASPARAKALSSVVWKHAPQMPERFKTAAKLARFKRTQREFDQVVLDLQLASPDAVQERNSLIPHRQAIRLVDFDHAHATVAI